VRGLQARRDGLAASVRCWADRFNRESADRSNLDAIIADAKRPADADFAIAMFSKYHAIWFAYEYWMGRYEADAPAAKSAMEAEEG
jgi:hypothetical protein